jgi:hypothetical protein
MPRSRWCGPRGWWGCSPPAWTSQPLEIPLLRDFIRIHLSGRAYPQMVLRLGAISEKAVSVRRPVDEVLF